jgi:hypothetical protein
MVGGLEDPMLLAVGVYRAAKNRLYHRTELANILKMQKNLKVDDYIKLLEEEVR